jgi:TonB family protein
MKETRMPVAAVASIAVHLALFMAFLWSAQKASDGTKQIVANVDLIIPMKKMDLPQPLEQKAKQTTLDFLKLALPAIPRAAAPKAITMNLPDVRKPIAPELPNKIVERKRMDMPKLAGMDLGSRNADIAKLDVSAPARRTAAIAAAPVLEEVGRRRSKLAEVQGLEDAGRSAQLQAIRPMGMDSGRRAVAAQAVQPALAEAARPSSFGSKLAEILPEAAPMQARPMGAMPSAIKSPVAETKAPPRRTEALPGKSKSVELEGPIADRKVAAYEIPQFPAWAKDLGLVEAEVRIRFWVSRDGDVLADMRVEHTSGYGRLDRHAMESLKKWKFAPIFSDEKQWGVITFKFIME